MSTPIASISQDKDDDGPEEGEIEDDDDEDDIIMLGSSPQRSISTNASIDIFPNTTSKESYERDIRRHELHRARAARIRRASGGPKSPYGVGSAIRGSDLYSRTKPRHFKTGVTQGKENRHVRRHKSPLSIHLHRKGSHDRAWVDYKETSSPRSDSSCSSIDSEDRSSYHRSTHRRSSRIERTKRKSSSSPDSVYTSSRRKSHHAEKCPLIKVLHCVAKETRLIAMETSENHSESSSLRQKLLNMGVMPALPQQKKSSSKDENVQTAVKSGCRVDSVSDNSSTLAQNQAININSGRKNEACNEGTQTDSALEEIVVVKKEPEVVILTDSEDGGCNGNQLPERDLLSSRSDKSDLVDKPSNQDPANGSESSNLNPSGTAVTVDDDDDDISHLRLLALQSKKHEQTPPDDADVLQLRLAALKTAFVKKFKTRKRMKTQADSVSKEDPLSFLDEIPLPQSPHSLDEVMTPVDMELAETDDESVHSFSNCYSPSDPTVSPLHDPSLQELLPPPPPPDLPIDIYYSDQKYENSFHCVSMEDTVPGVNYMSPADPLLPPPLPPYFRELLAGMPNDLVFIPPADLVHSHLSIDADALGSENLPTIQNTPEESDAHFSLISCDENSECSKNGSFDTAIIPASERPNLLEVPIISELAPKDGELFVSSDGIIQNTKSNTPSKNLDQNTKNISFDAVFKTELGSHSLCGDNNDTEVSTKITIDKIPQRKFSLEEEEQLLRQRLLLNMANKRGTVSVVNGQSSVAKAQEVSLKNKPKNNTSLKPASNKPTEFSAVKIKPSCVSPLPSLNQPCGRVVVDLGEDSDSSGDYLEAETLGLKCAKNREIWLRQMKELDINIPKLLGPGNKAKGNSSDKLSPQTANLKAKPISKERSVTKPFAENLADLESSVERFLKGVRSSHESISKSKPGAASVSVTRTPVAVRHLPASQQEEYRQLKQRIAKLEKQRQISSELQKQVPRTVSKATQMNAATGNGNPKQVVKTSYTKPALPLKQPNRTIVVCTPGKSKIENVVSDRNISQTQQPSKTGLESTVPLMPTRVTVSQAGLDGVIAESRREVSLKRGNKALANVSNLNIPCAKPDSNLINKDQMLKLSKTEDGKVHHNPQGLATLQSNLVTERSHVLMELSALAKLLSQVDKSLEAQSHTAAEVASLLDKLCLAAGRWKAQNRTVTSLVARVAQRQKELSLRHRRCVAISKSCSELGGQLHGKNYRVPSSKADAMRLQLKQVHEKTQYLAKRRTIEQARKGTLEKRAEHCLIKLFSDTRANNVSKGNSAKSSVQAVATSLGSVQKDVKNDSPQVDLSVSELNSNKLGKLPDNEKLKLGVSSEAINSSPVSARACSRIVDSTPKANTAIISRVLSYRMAQNKLKSAKAILNFSKRKRISTKQNHRNVKKFCSNRRSEERSRPDLSDMDISTDGEEVERNNTGGNTEVVDMSVSPDASSSPLYVDSMASFTVLKNKGIGSIENRSNVKTTSENSEQSSTRSPNQKSRTQVNSQKNDKSSSENNSENTVQVLSKNVLKDYISPLGGLNVFSSSTRKATPKGDLYAILCPYDLNGKCEDSECPFKHQQHEEL